MTYALRLIAGVMMIVAVIAAAVSASDALDILGRPGAEQMLGAIFLIAFACFLTAFLAAGVLWVLAEISERVELLSTVTAEDESGEVRVSSSVRALPRTQIERRSATQ